MRVREASATTAAAAKEGVNGGDDDDVALEAFGPTGVVALAADTNCLVCLSPIEVDDEVCLPLSMASLYLSLTSYTAVFWSVLPRRTCKAALAAMRPCLPSRMH